MDIFQQQLLLDLKFWDCCLLDWLLPDNWGKNLLCSLPSAQWAMRLSRLAGENMHSSLHFVSSHVASCNPSLASENFLICMTRCTGLHGHFLQISGVLSVQHSPTWFFVLQTVASLVSAKSQLFLFNSGSLGSFCSVAGNSRKEVSWGSSRGPVIYIPFSGNHWHLLPCAQCLENNFCQICIFFKWG